MKIFKKQIHVAATLFVAAALVFTTSCTKNSDNPATSTPEKSEVKAVTDKHVQEDIQGLVDRLPPIAWYNSTMDKVIVFDPLNNSKSFDFSNPNNGWEFSGNEGVEFIENPSGGGVLFVTPGAFGASGAGTGTVVAGNTVLNIDFAMCLSASEEFFGFGSDIADLGFDGLSMVIGISGNFEALTTEEFDADDTEDTDAAGIFSYFNGIAAYLVYDDEAQGSYQIANYLDDVEGVEEEETLQGAAFSVVAGFTSNSISLYFSKNGSLNVTGGSMDFSGNYFGVVLDGLPTMDDSGEVYGMNYVEVSGYGEMGCL